MDLELSPKSDSPIIEGYGSGYVTVSGKKITDIFIIFPDKFEVMKSGDLNLIIKSIKLYKNKLDLIIYGTNMGIDKKNELIKMIKVISLPIEFMETSAACRTWSVLIGEGRSVGAIISPS